MEAMLIEKISAEMYSEQALFETELKYLSGAEAVAEFQFD